MGISGGDKDFEVLLLDDDNYVNWSTGHTYRPRWESGRVVVQQVDQRLPAPGKYHLVVSNEFSLLSPKAVTVSANVSCPGLW